MKKRFFAEKIFPREEKVKEFQKKPSLF